MKRVYLDWNATAPLRPEARAAMLAAMDCVGNPSSVHAEGRAAKAIVEKARGQVADLIRCDTSEVIFTSNATEAAALASSGARKIHCGDGEHNCLIAWRDKSHGSADVSVADSTVSDIYVWPVANSETGILGLFPSIFKTSGVGGVIFTGEAKILEDITQVSGRVPYGFERGSTASFALLSSHKFGGPKGAGALIARDGTDLNATHLGGGQEKGRRSGTENVIGIAGMGAAAEAAAKDLENGVWQIVEQNRNVFEERLLNEVPELIIFGKDVPRLPNTSYFAVKGWKAETQVMQMDLNGFAVSAGSACSSGKVRASRVLKAMGYDEITAGSAIRVSIGPSTTAAELESFADAWLAEYKRFKARREGK